MSHLLDALILQRKHEALDYAAYLAKIVELTRQAKNGPGGVAYPQSLNTAAKRALFDNLGQDEGLALAVDAVVRSSRQDEWRTNPFKIKRVRNALKAALGDDESLADKVLELVKNQNEY